MAAFIQVPVTRRTKFPCREYSLALIGTKKRRQAKLAGEIDFFCTPLNPNDKEGLDAALYEAYPDTKFKKIKDPPAFGITQDALKPGQKHFSVAVAGLSAVTDPKKFDVAVSLFENDLEIGVCLDEDMLGCTVHIAHQVPGEEGISLEHAKAQSAAVKHASEQYHGIPFPLTISEEELPPKPAKDNTIEYQTLEAEFTTFDNKFDAYDYNRDKRLENVLGGKLPAGDYKYADDVFTRFFQNNKECQALIKARGILTKYYFTPVKTVEGRTECIKAMQDFLTTNKDKLEKAYKEKENEVFDTLQTSIPWSKGFKSDIEAQIDNAKERNDTLTESELSTLLKPAMDICKSIQDYDTGPKTKESTERCRSKIYSFMKSDLYKSFVEEEPEPELEPVPEGEIGEEEPPPKPEPEPEEDLSEKETLDTLRVKFYKRRDDLNENLNSLHGLEKPVAITKDELKTRYDGILLALMDAASVSEKIALFEQGLQLFQQTEDQLNTLLKEKAKFEAVGEQVRPCLSKLDDYKLTALKFTLETNLKIVQGLNEMEATLTGVALMYTMAYEAYENCITAILEKTKAKFTTITAELDEFESNHKESLDDAEVENIKRVEVANYEDYRRRGQQTLEKSPALNVIDVEPWTKIGRLDTAIEKCSEVLTALELLVSEKLAEVAPPEPEATASAEAAKEDAPDPAAAPVETEEKEEVVPAPERWGQTAYRLEHVKAHMMTEWGKIGSENQKNAIELVAKLSNIAFKRSGDQKINGAVYFIPSAKKYPETLTMLAKSTEDELEKVATMFYGYRSTSTFDLTFERDNNMTPIMKADPFLKAMERYIKENEGKNKINYVELGGRDDAPKKIYYGIKLIESGVKIYEISDVVVGGSARPYKDTSFMQMLTTYVAKGMHEDNIPDTTYSLMASSAGTGAETPSTRRRRRTPKDRKEGTAAKSSRPRRKAGTRSSKRGKRPTDLGPAGDDDAMDTAGDL